MATKKVLIATEISSCRECKHFSTTNQCSTDGFDRMEDWVCKHGEGKPRKIQGAVEWHEENKIEVPDWCPLRIPITPDEWLRVKSK